MFYVLAALIVLAALATVLAPSTRLVLLAVMLGDVLVGVLLIAAGAWFLGAIALVAPVQRRSTPMPVATAAATCSAFCTTAPR